MYGLNGRNEKDEMKKRYEAMVNVFSDLLSCGRDDIEELFDSENNIEVGDIVRECVKDTGELPTWNELYRIAMWDFAEEYNLDMGVDVDIYTNFCLDTRIYAREGLDNEIKEKLENLFNMQSNVLVE